MEAALAKARSFWIVVVGLNVVLGLSAGVARASESGTQGTQTDGLRTLFGLLATSFGLAAAVLSHKAARVNVRLTERDRTLASRQAQIQELDGRLQELAQFVRGCYRTAYVDFNVIVLGPRTAGKTSFATAWTKHWKGIHGLPPTPNFVKHEYVFPTYRERIGANQIAGIPFDEHEHARFVIWDYGGEDHLRDAALDELSKLERCTLCLVLTAEDGHSRKNDEYFSMAFLASVRHVYAKRDLRIRVVVLFNKIDLAGSSWTLDGLKAKNDRSIQNLAALFGASAAISYHAISAETGQGILDVFRLIGAQAVDDNGHART